MPYNIFRTFTIDFRTCVLAVRVTFEAAFEPPCRFPVGGTFSTIIIIILVQRRKFYVIAVIKTFPWNKIKHVNCGIRNPVFMFCIVSSLCLTVHFMVECYIVTICLTSVWKAILFRNGKILPWNKIATHCLIELFLRRR